MSASKDARRLACCYVGYDRFAGKEEDSTTVLRTSLCYLLGIRYPIFQAPMAGGWTTPALVSEVSNAGGLGMLAGARVSPDQLREDIKAVKDQKDRPFGVNFLLA